MPHTSETIHIAKLLEKHKGKWVALFQDEKHVAGVGATIDEALAEARANGEDHPVLIKAPDQFSAFLL